MFNQSIALFRARKDPALATNLAREMAVDGVIDRASVPLVIAKFWMGVVLFGLTLLGGFIVIGAAASHWSVGILALPFFGLDYLIIRIWRGLDRGHARVKHLVHEYSATALDGATTRFRRPADEHAPPT